MQLVLFERFFQEKILAVMVTAFRNLSLKKMSL